MATTAMTVRLDTELHELLTGMAKLRGENVSEFAKNLIEDGLTKAMDPEEIEAAIEAEKVRLLTAVSKLRQSNAKH
ncbi:DUF6290 family protein [Rhodococcus sp. UFZ-B548]|uniref:DUF6290 family protein n=1 Tax=Rhodococcus sp. UFZ-B548 TaxID=2742212 RepID=UPI0015F395A2|nr:DUF6290 family protein [Rhodococcus sp. UFZ-B548]